ncbi:uncharacterized protein LOC133396362 [Phycodurus eques]|uniref:uncharacterized protein LOC133396362 n=1 Tax=Phycodurus eques TaxID=693459 RepID=UPI002ACE6EB7|nr:uncharacterized protein LOC133396362 [Phycodurus eques]
MHPIRPECHPRPMLPTFPVGSRFSQPAAMMTGPNMYNVQQQIRPPVHLNSFHNHNQQQLSHQWPVQNILGPHPQQMMRAPSGMMMTPGAPQMVPVGFMNGEILFEQVHPLMSAAPPQNLFTTINTRKTEHVRERPYIKKPPNAFMLFANKYREVVTMQLEKRDSASVHVALGKMSRCSGSWTETTRWFQRTGAQYLKDYTLKILGTPMEVATAGRQGQILRRS